MTGSFGDLDAGSAEHGFSAALLIPAALSTLKQAQREAAAELHVLANYHRSCRARSPPPPPSPAERQAAYTVGRVVSQQALNGAGFFLAVKAALALGGTDAGMLAQVGITLNSMTTPGQTQRLNPARDLFARVGRQPDWVCLLPEPLQRRFMDQVGRFAVRCGYGGLDQAGPLMPPDLATEDWDHILDAAPKSSV